MPEEIHLSVEVEPARTEVEVEAYHTEVEIDFTGIETWFYYLHPAQVLREDKEVAL